jgi:hypothetical protein
MSRNQFDAVLTRLIRNLPETGLDPLLFEYKILCDGVDYVAVFQSAEYASKSLLFKALIAQIGRTPPDKQIALARLEAATAHEAPVTIRTGLTGWRTLGCGNRVFVTPARTFGALNREVEFADSATGIGSESQIGSCAGTIEGWNDRIGSVMRQSSAGITLVGAVLSAPLLHLRPQKETFVLNMAGMSTIGKTTLLKGALSIQGDPHFASPETTNQGLRELAGEHNHLVLAFGDLNQLSPTARKHVLHRVIYEVTSGDSRIVSKSVKAKLPSFSYRTIIFTSAERPSSELSLLDRRQEFGAAVRCFDLTPPMPEPLYYLDRLSADESRTPKEIMDSIPFAVQQEHGEMLRAWTRWISKQDEAAISAKFIRESALLSRDLDLTDGLSCRIADAFGFMCTSLLLARRAGVLNWTKDEIREGIQQSLSAVLARSHVSAEIDPVTALRRACEREGAVIEMDQVAAAAPESWIAVQDPERGLLLSPSKLQKVIGAVLVKQAIEVLTAQGKVRDTALQQRDLAGRRPRLIILDPGVLG